MNWRELIVILSVFVSCRNQVQAQFDDYVVPDATFEVFKPKGLRVSIPHEAGIRLFAFHASINDELPGTTAGTINKDVNRQKDGNWIFWDPNIRLKMGDEIYYWTYVDYNDGEKTLGYTNQNNKFVVKNLIPISQLNQPIPKRGNKKTTTVPTTTTTTTTTPKPRPNTKKPPASACAEKGVTIANGKTGCPGELLFEDNFINFDKTKWKQEVKIATHPDYEFCIYLNSPDNVAVKNGNLFLKPTLTTQKFGEDILDKQINLGRNCTGVPGSIACSKTAVSYQILPPVLSGRVSTKDSFSFLYGKVEIRAKLPKGKWMYPIMFLQPKNSEYGEDYDSGQMRIAFVPGNENLGKDLSGGVILSPTEDGRNYGMRFSQNEELWSNAFHTYVLKWRPNKITVSVDGTDYGTIEPPEGGFASEAGNIGSTAGERWSEGTSLAPFDKEMYLTLGVGVGGHSFSDDVAGGKPWKNKNPKNMLNFWEAKDQWYNTWSDQSALRIDYVKITAY